MPQDLVLPDPDDAEFAGAVRSLRDHLLGAVDEDLQIALDGQPYVVAWADRRPAEFDAPYFDITSAMRVVEREHRSPEVIGTGEEQITLVVDGERFIFHLVEVPDDAGGTRRLPAR
jgi:hypothetical protein